MMTRSRVEDSGLEITRPKKRKLRFPRISNACNFCRRRKVRCSGTQPCEVCVREEATCHYAEGGPSRAASTPRQGSHPFTSENSPIYTDNLGKQESFKESSSTAHAVSSNLNDQVQSRQSSLEPPQVFSRGTHVGPTSGVSFLYGQWTKPPLGGDVKVVVADDDVPLSQAPLVSYGDLPRLESGALCNLPQPIFTIEQLLELTTRFFQYVSPTYRYHHQPTIEDWATAYVMRDRSLTNAQQASVLLICAQTLLHSCITPTTTESGDERDVRLSTACAERARSLLEKEPGPPSLTSIQARIGMCLYFLSTFRLNECRYCFSFAMTTVTALGIHRKQSSSLKFGILEAEMRKRTFWCAYVLDGYISVMMGRPRLIRDEDIDQPFPHNIADNDLMSSESVDDLPRLGNLEAFVAHAKLAKLLARGNDLLYPLQQLTKDQLLRRSNDMLDAMSCWKKELPGFLQPREKTMTGQRTFERQNTILKLGFYHVQILATRRLLIMNHGCRAHHQANESSVQRPIRECISAIETIIDTVNTLINHGKCNDSFWTTQYIALVAISTFYVFIVQGVRRALPGNLDSFLSVEEVFSKARRCQDYLATLPPPCTQAERHHVLLGHLRSKAEKSLVKRTLRNASVIGQLPPAPSKLHINEPQSLQATSSTSNSRSEASLSLPTNEPLRLQAADALKDHRQSNPIVETPTFLNDESLFASMLTPGSGSDIAFPGLDFGWESLDTIGLGQELYPFDVV